MDIYEGGIPNWVESSDERVSDNLVLTGIGATH
jgi:hypothetical protein